ncbi:MAG: hypothetical protein U5K56_06935 [Halioglobus sp.]|nr:hypothetical protein [Halioglobus sp.]
MQVNDVLVLPITPPVVLVPGVMLAEEEPRILQGPREKAGAAAMHPQNTHDALGYPEADFIDRRFPDAGFIEIVHLTKLWLSSLYPIRGTTHAIITQYGLPWQPRLWAISVIERPNLRARDDSSRLAGAASRPSHGRAATKPATFPQYRAVGVVTATV